MGGGKIPANFEEFLKARFGHTLYELYFRPYNEKIWRRSLSDVPLDWLEGKLPMPTAEDIIFNNFNHVEERQFVHSTFYYEKDGGSQFLADKLAEGTDIAYNCQVGSIERTEGGWAVSGISASGPDGTCFRATFDKVVFCGNIKQLPAMLRGIDIGGYAGQINELEYHGTTAVFCQIDANPYSWLYQPSREHSSHRIICTGNFSPANNAAGITTGTVEFTDNPAEETILADLAKMPLHPHYIARHFSKYTYPIQKPGTRTMIASLKAALRPEGFHITGRFADWEYYNMDAAMGAVMDEAPNINL